MAVDLAQSGVAASLHHRDHTIDPLDVIDVLGNSISALTASMVSTGIGEELIDHARRRMVRAARTFARALWPFVPAHRPATLIRSRPCRREFFRPRSTASASFWAHLCASVCANSAWSSAKIVLKNFSKTIRKVVPGTGHVVSKLLAKKLSSASKCARSDQIRISTGATARPPIQGTLTSAMNISSMISTGFTAAQTRARSWS